MVVNERSVTGGSDYVAALSPPWPCAARRPPDRAELRGGLQRGAAFTTVPSL
jgi:hypothetical protein